VCACVRACVCVYVYVTRDRTHLYGQKQVHFFMQVLLAS